MNKFWALSALVLRALTWVPAVHAAGFQNYLEQGAAATGQACAVVARGADASALYFNPGSSALLTGTRFHATANGVIPRTTYTPDGEEPAIEMSSDVVPLGALHITHQAAERWVVGLAVNTPYGSRTAWSETWQGRYYADLTSVKSVYVTPTAAYRMTEDLSLGVGAALVWGQATVERPINAPLAFAAAVPEMAAAFASGAFTAENDIYTRLEGDDWGYGARAGLHWQASERVSFGAAFHSAVDLTITGDARYAYPTYVDESFGGVQGTGEVANQLALALFPETRIETHMTLPASASAGSAVRIGERLDVEADFSWTGWSSYDALDVVYKSLAGQSNATSSTPKDWKDVWAVRLGAEYALSERFVGRLGYSFDESPIPDATRDPSLPGSDRHDLSVGLGLGSRAWTIDAAYLLVLMDDPGSELNAPANGDLSGGYASTAHVVALSVAYAF